LVVLLAGGIAGAALFYFSPSRAVLVTLEDEVRPRGGVLHVEKVRRGVLEDSLEGARIELGDGTALVAPQTRVVRRAAGSPEIRVPNARIELRRDPLSAFNGFRTLAGAVPAEVSVGRVSVDYQHRSVGHLTMDGLRRVAETDDDSFTAQKVRLGRMAWSDVAFSVTARSRALEVQLGPRMTARYLASDGKAAEWLIQVPRQPFGGDPARITGTFTWIVPEDPAVASRGSFHFVVDDWPQPPWPDASALVGRSGSVAASVVLSSDPATLRLERLKVETGHFPLDGTGTVTLAEHPEIHLEAKGKRACTELAQALPSSRYRDLIAAYEARDGEFVELSVRVVISTRDGLMPRFDWRLSAGCGLEELSTAR
jgi:hypothetical protein